MQLHEVLLRPLITEKATDLQAQGRYVFEVAKVANKIEVKQAVEKGFKVKVTSVNIIMVPGATKRLGKRIIPARSWKKAIVTLKPGDKIEIFHGV